MAYQTQTPFHVVGTRVPSLTSLDEALRQTGLDWEVRRQKLYLADGTEFKGHYGMVRMASDGTIKRQLGTVGRKYHETQNRQNAAIVEPLIERHGCTVEAGGTFNGGGRCFLLLRMPNVNIEPIPGDPVKGFNLLAWNHDGNGGITNSLTTIRPVCANTLAAAIRQGKGYEWAVIQHRSSAQERIQQAAELVSQATAAMLAVGETFAALARRRMSRDELVAFIEAAIPSEAAGDTPSTIITNRRETVLQLAYSGRGADAASSLINTAGGAVSAWAALNGVTEYVDHVRPAEAKSEATRAKANESALFGANALFKQDAFMRLRELVAA